MSETKNIRLTGHAFRPKKNPYGRNVLPGCECGETIGNPGPVNMETARFVHNEHKRRIRRDASRLGTHA